MQQVNKSIGICQPSLVTHSCDLKRQM